MLDYLCEECEAAFISVKNNLDSYEIPFTVDPGIVRGLDYYTKTAFEFVTNSIGAQGTVCGGGRYDYLIEELGGPPIPGVGFGMGIERLLLVMEVNGVIIPEPSETDLFIAFIGEEGRDVALKLSHDLRKEGFSILMDTMSRNIKGQLKYADRLNVKRVAIIGEEELSQNEVSIKDMVTGTQTKVSFEMLKDYLK